MTLWLMSLAAYIEWLRKEVSLAEEEDRKLSAEISDIGETVFKGGFAWGSPV
jgi:hypothetical protein